MLGNEVLLKQHIHLAPSLALLLAAGEHVDLTIVCEGGEKLLAHKLILSAASSYFRSILETARGEQTILVLRDVAAQDMGDLLTFVYSGSVSLPRQRLGPFLAAGRALQINGVELERTDIVQDVCESLENSEELSEVKMEASDALNPEEYSDDFTQNIRLDCPDSPISVDIKSETEQSERGAEVVDSVDFNQVTYNDVAQHSVTSSANVPHSLSSVSAPGTAVSTDVPQQAVISDNARDMIRTRIFGGWAHNPKTEIGCYRANVDPKNINWLEAQAGSLSKRGLVESDERLLVKKPCVCTQCGERFSFRNQLTAHKKIVHEGNNF
jgi:hypothetical protein